jgi:hypothetical protein
MESADSFVDDPNILDDELLYRGILPQSIKPDGTIASMAFKDHHRSHISVDRSSCCSAEETFARLNKSAGIAELPAGAPRALRPVVAGVAANPVKDNRAHALILRANGVPEKLWIEAASALARACRWAIQPKK